MKLQAQPWRPREQLLAQHTFLLLNQIQMLVDEVKHDSDGY